MANSLKDVAAKLAAMNDEDFYNYVMGGTNATGKKRLMLLRQMLKRVK